MAQIKLEDLLVKKKEAPQVLDLSKSVVTSKEDLRKLLDRIPEYKIRPEKVRLEEIKIKTKDFSFKPQKKEIQHQSEYSYPNPVPPDMSSVALEDLSPVPIDWKMLTSVRPRLKVDEDMFTRLVTMGKLHLSTALKDKQCSVFADIRRTKNRAGILETRAEMCTECSEEFCSGGICGEFQYESFMRIDELTRHKMENATNANGGLKKRKARKKKRRKLTKGKKKRGKKSSKKKSEKKEK